MSKARVTEDITCGWYVEGWGVFPDGTEGVTQLSRIYYNNSTVNGLAVLARKTNPKPETVQVRTKFYRARKGREQLFA